MRFLHSLVVSYTALFCAYFHFLPITPLLLSPSYKNDLLTFGNGHKLQQNSVKMHMKRRVDYHSHSLLCATKFAAWSPHRRRYRPCSFMFCLCHASCKLRSLLPLSLNLLEIRHEALAIPLLHQPNRPSNKSWCDGELGWLEIITKGPSEG